MFVVEKVLLLLVISLTAYGFSSVTFQRLTWFADVLYELQHRTGFYEACRAQKHIFDSIMGQEWIQVANRMIKKKENTDIYSVMSDD